DFLSGQLCQLSDLLPGHDERVGEFRCRRCQNHNVAALEYFFRDRQGSGVGELPVAADEPCGSLRTADGNGWQGPVDPSLLKETGFGSEPCGALPCREQPRCDSDGLRCLLRPSEDRSRSWDSGDGTRDQMQELATEKLHGVLRI